MYFQIPFAKKVPHLIAPHFMLGLGLGKLSLFNRSTSTIFQLYCGAQPQTAIKL